MNHHFRSFSEHHQPLQNNQHQLHSASNSNNINGSNQVELPDSSSTSASGIIRIHSDSQQSLDQLFNLSNSQASVPLRNRNLPASFFNPSLRAKADNVETDAPNPQPTNSFHFRSTSFNHERRLETTVEATGKPGATGNLLHMRTQSTIAPMSSARSMNTTEWPGERNGNSNQYQQMNVDSSTDSLRQAQVPQQQLAPVVHQQLAQMPQQRPNQYHCRNYSSPAFMNGNQNIGCTQAAPDSHTNHFYPSTYQQQRQPYNYYPQSQRPQHQPSPGTYLVSTKRVPPINEQKFHISHSQPYSMFDQNHSASSSSTNLLNSQATMSSSSSIEISSNSLCTVPTQSMHSRSSSFDERQPIPNNHSRSQSTLSGMDTQTSNGFGGSNGFVNSTATGCGYARPVQMMCPGGAPVAAQINQTANTYGQATLVAVEDEPMASSGVWTEPPVQQQQFSCANDYHQASYMDQPAGASANLYYRN